MREPLAESLRTWMAGTLAGEPGWMRASWRVAATPASWAYAAAVATARSRNRRRCKRMPGTAVISIGGLTLGGSGKTPCAVWLAGVCRSWGRAPAVISRGYRAPLGRDEVRRAAAGDGAHCGDEAAELAQRLGPGIPVFVARDRWRAGLAARDAGADVLLLDDAFHLYRPLPDFRLVLLDARRPWGSGRVLPAGDLRERPRTLEEADAILLTRVGGANTRRLRETLSRLAPSTLVAEADHVAVGVVSLDGTACQTSSGPWWILSGIARPDAVVSAAHALGLTVVGHTALGDHAELGERLVREVERAAAAVDAHVLTTEKDAARLTPVSRERVGATWRAVRVAFRPGTGGDLLLARMRACVMPGGL